MEDNSEYDDELGRALRVGYHNVLGVERAAANAFQAALGEFDAALKICPTFAEGWFHRGLVLMQLRRLDVAYDSFAQAVIHAPMFREAEEQLASTGRVLGRACEILTPWRMTRPPVLLRTYRKFMKQPPRIEDVDINESEASLRRDLTRTSKFASHAPALAAKLGWRLHRERRWKEAELFFRYALALEPWNGLAAAGLCLLCEDAGQLAEMGKVAIAAMRAGANEGRLPMFAYWAALSAGDWTHICEWRRKSLIALNCDARAATSHVLYVTDEPELHLRAAKEFARLYENSCAPLPAAVSRSKDGPITLGYVSADFRDHPVARLSAELFELHDRERFRVFGYGVMSDPQSNGIGDRVRKSFDRYVDLSRLSPGAAAERIRADGVDILIDLSGNTAHGPNAITARRPAPIQVNYLGYPGTTGSSRMDYIIVDRIVTPREQQKWFTEALVYMPDSHQVNDRKRKVAADAHSRAFFGLPDKAVVYCSFNETRKITPELFRVWMTILTRVPASVLWLSVKGAEPRDNFRRCAAEAGVNSDRLIFADRLPNHENHMARYLHCDFFLDTVIYNGHATTSDALWAGCPGVALRGKSYATRVAASLLEAAGLPELVVESMPDYEELAVRVGVNDDLRRDFRARLAASRATCSLFNTPRFVRHLEWAFRRMVDTFVAGHPPTLFEVPAEPVL